MKNHLTGEREAISTPCSFTLTDQLQKKHLKETRYKRHQPWSKYKIEEESFNE
jgi:hypothetical protein